MLSIAKRIVVFAAALIFGKLGYGPKRASATCPGYKRRLVPLSPKSFPRHRLQRRRRDDAAITAGDERPPRSLTQSGWQPSRRTTKSPWPLPSFLHSATIFLQLLTRGNRAKLESQVRAHISRCKIRKLAHPTRFRTCDLCLRRATLYPAELRVRGGSFSRLAGQGQRPVGGWGGIGAGPLRQRSHVRNRVGCARKARAGRAGTVAGHPSHTVRPPEKPKIRHSEVRTGLSAGWFQLH